MHSVVTVKPIAMELYTVQETEYFRVTNHSLSAILRTDIVHKRFRETGITRNPCLGRELTLNWIVESSYIRQRQYNMSYVLHVKHYISRTCAILDYHGILDAG